MRPRSRHKMAFEYRRIVRQTDCASFEREGYMMGDTRVWAGVAVLRPTFRFFF